MHAPNGNRSHNPMVRGTKTHALNRAATVLSPGLYICTLYNYVYVLHSPMLIVQSGHNHGLLWTSVTSLGLLSRTETSTVANWKNLQRCTYSNRPGPSGWRIKARPKVQMTWTRTVAWQVAEGVVRCASCEQWYAHFKKDAVEWLELDILHECSGHPGTHSRLFNILNGHCNVCKNASVNNSPYKNTRPIKHCYDMRIYAGHWRGSDKDQNASVRCKVCTAEEVSNSGSTWYKEHISVSKYLVRRHLPSNCVGLRTAGRAQHSAESHRTLNRVNLVTRCNGNLVTEVTSGP